MNDVEKEFFKYEKQMELMKKLQPFIIELKTKYKNSVNLYIEFDSILICINDKSIKKDIKEIITTIIKWTKEKMEEDYFLSSNYPVEMWSNPSKEDVTFSWLLERKLKEDEIV